SIMLITHDLGVVSEVCDRVIVMYAGMIVEEAEIDELFAAPKHPYTIGLLHSMPDIEKNQNRLDTIPGMVPQAEDMVPGCKFAPRCAFARDICFSQVPPKVQFTDSHSASCWLNEKEAGD